MRFLIDENLSPAVKTWFESKGFDVVHARDVAPGTSDSEWIRRSAAEARIVVTLDKDFGELAFVANQRPRGVILLRIKPLEMSSVLRRLDEVWSMISEELDIHFIVISNQSVRIRMMAND